MCPLVFIDWLDNLLEAVKIALEKQSDLSTPQEASKGPVIRFRCVDRRPQMQALKSKLAPHALSANHQQLREADTESCASLLQQGLRLACDNCAIEALAKLQQAKDLASIEAEASEAKIRHYKRALELFESAGHPEVTEKNDWWAVTQLKLSDAHLQARPNDILAAAAALQKALDHFQAQKTARAHFHTAKALYKRALIFDAEDNSMMKVAFQAAAKELLTQAVGADDTVGRNLALHDFDEKIPEPWFK